MSGTSPEGDGQLLLDEPDLRLPWLESADEDRDEGLDWGRIGKFVAVVAVLLVAIVAAALYLRGALDAPPAGDGSLIEAPDEPYKIRPADAGGSVVAGTGDLAYKVGEGRGGEAKLGGSGESLGPVPVPTAAASGEPAATESPTPAPALSGVGVQIGAYSSEADAQKGWDTVRSRYEPLGGYAKRIVQGRADIGSVWRLQAVAPTTAAAFALCDDMRRNGIECQVKR